MITGKAWDNVNTLLSFLRSFDAVEIVDQHYRQQHGNDAPGQLLKEQLAIVQLDLDRGGK